MNRKKLIAVGCLALFFAPIIATPDEATDLKEIMQGLRDNFVEVTDGLLVDDFERVAQAATAIADHPKIPPAQVKLVAMELGSEMVDFKKLDILVHDLSLQLSDAARARDREATVDAYQQVIEACVECHRGYKDRVAAVLTPP